MLAHLVICCFLASLISSELKVKGIGDSMNDHVYKAWQSIFEAQNPELKDVFSFNGTSSNMGECVIRGNCYDANAPYMYASSVELVDHMILEDDPNMLVFPVLAGAMVIAYNLRGIDLKLHLSDLVEIFSGEITYWNDTRLQGGNNNKLPSEPILPIARSDENEASEMLSKAFAKISYKWKDEHAFPLKPLLKENDWFTFKEGVIKFYPRHEIGVVGVLRSVKHSITFLPHDVAIERNLQIASLVNSFGYLITPSRVRYSVEEALNQSVLAYKETKQFQMVNHATVTAYPLVLMTYIIVNMSTSVGISCEEMAAFIRFASWFLTNKEAKEAALYHEMVPVGSQIGELIKTNTLSKVRCGGVSVLEIVEAETKAQRRKAKLSHDLIVGFSISTTLLIIGIVSSGSFYMFYSKNKQLKARNWLLLPQIAGLDDANDRCGSSSSSKTSMSRQKNFGDEWFGQYNGNDVIFHPFCVSDTNPRTYPLSVSKKILEMTEKINHDNIMKFIGLIRLSDKPLALVYTYGNFKGWLHTVLQLSHYDVRDEVRIVLARDVANGMEYLHKKEIVHGALNSTSCFLDLNWTVKIGDWAQVGVLTSLYGTTKWPQMLREKYLKAFAAGDSSTTTSILIQYSDPGLLRDTFEDVSIASGHDIYSFGMLLAELSQGAEPFAQLSRSDTLALLKRLSTGEEKMYLPPKTKSNMKLLVQKCLQMDISKRPSFQQLLLELESISKSCQKGVVGILLDSIESYMGELEDKIEIRTAKLKHMTAKMEKLIFSMLPQEIASKIEKGLTVESKYFDDVSVYFSDIVGFVTLCSELSPLQIVNLLNTVYTKFDSIVDNFNVYKVETIGDAYMVASGVPQPIGPSHVKEISGLAISLISATREIEIQHETRRLEIRVGMHAGPCLAGVVGLKLPRYCLFGDTVNTASRMESSGLPMRIHVSEPFAKRLAAFPEFQCERRGNTEIKGKGIMTTYWLMQPDGPCRETPTMWQKASHYLL